jgi:hypothetical protein
VIHWRSAQVTAIRSEWPGVREVAARLEAPLPAAPASEPGEHDEPGRGGEPESVRALAYTDLVGSPEPGDRVLLNVSSLARRLGTGGFALVVAIPDRLPADPPPGPGHLVKDRYSPLQTMVLGVDDQESEHHEALAAAGSLEGMPVLVADLHSALPAVAAGVLAARPGTRIAYVLTDGAALPMAFSRAVAGLKEAGWLAGTVSTGQAHGGDLEAVTVHSGLLAARHVLGAEVAVVAQGPGNLGTGTAWGFSGVVCGDHLNAAQVLGGRPIGVLRVSGADRRERHHGISHHSMTALGKVAQSGVDVPLPDLRDPGLECPPELAGLVAEQARTLAGRHRIVPVACEGLGAALKTSPVALRTMGRGLEDDPAAFLAAAAAGRHAASLL